MTYIVALTGGIGSGKTVVSNTFKKIGIDIIDTDIIAKKILKKNHLVLDSVKKKFGKKILNSDDSINRTLLRKYIFNDASDRIWLENLLHPKILQETKQKIYQTKSIWCLWVVPLLFEKKLHKNAHRILLIDTPVKTQIKRIMQRDNISLQEAKKILFLQTSRRKRIFLSDDIIVNKNQINQISTYVYHFNIFYSYLSKIYKNNLFNTKKNYLTKFL